MKKALKITLGISEPLILLALIYTFWFHSPPIRDSWLWLLWFSVPIFRLRMVVYQRLWVETPLNNLLVIFVILTAFNFATAPYARADYLALLSRPLLGIWLYLYFIDHAHTWKRLHGLVIATVGMSFVLGIISLTTTQYEVTGKSQKLAFIIDALPRFDWRSMATPIQIPFFVRYFDWASNIPSIKDMLLGFNPNEVAGALAFIVPLMAAFAIGTPTFPPQDNDERIYHYLWLGMRIAAGIAFVISLMSLFLGQSRFAIFGVIIALAIIVYLLMTNKRWKIIGMSGVTLLMILQLSLLFNLFPGNTVSTSNQGLSARDQNTVQSRLEIWRSAIQMMFDYPLTGTGMSMFRTAANDPRYQIEYYVSQGTTPPHAHNEWFQMGADLGILGFLLFIAMQIAVLWMLWKGWKSDIKQVQIVSIAVLGGLFAHSFYGIGDAVTFWDRFAFILWWLVGLSGAQFVLTLPEENELQANQSKQNVKSE